MLKRYHIPVSHLWAYGLLAFAQIAIAVNVVAGKYVISQMPTFVFLGIRFFISSVILTFLCVLSRQTLLSKAHTQSHVKKMDVFFLFAQALTGGFLFNFFFFWGMEYTTAMAGGIISSTLPAMIAICAFIFLGERLTRSKIIAILLAMLGIIVVSSHHASAREVSVFHDYWGDILVFLAMIPEALYSIFNKYSNKRFNALSSAMIVNWMICFMMIPMGYFECKDFYPTADFFLWGLIVVCALTSVVFYWAWPKGLEVVPANTAAVFGGLVPVVTSVLSWAFLQELFGWHEAVGLLCVFAALLLGIDWHHRSTPHPKSVERA